MTHFFLHFFTVVSRRHPCEAIVVYAKPLPLIFLHPFHFWPAAARAGYISVTPSRKVVTLKSRLDGIKRSPEFWYFYRGMMMDTCVVSLFSCVVYASLRNFRINTQLLIIVIPPVSALSCTGRKREKEKEEKYRERTKSTVSVVYDRTR